MAKLPLITSIILFFSFSSFSHARTSPEIDVINNDLSNTLPQSDTRTTIFLPSNKPEPDPVTFADEIPPESDVGAVDEPIPTHASNNVNFRPINRYYRGKRQFALGVPLRRCRHRTRSMSPSSGDIVISGESGSVYPMMIQGDGERRFAGRRVRLHHHRREDGDVIQRFRMFKHQVLAKDKFQRLFRYEQERENKKERGERSRGGFVSGIRKFLNPK